MAISKTISDQVEATARGGQLEQIAREHVEQLSRGVDQFLAFERENILKKDTSPEIQSEHRKILMFWLFVFRALQLGISPELKDRTIHEIIKGQLWRLEHSWQMVYEPMPDDDADKLLDEVFPNGPQA